MRPPPGKAAATWAELQRQHRGLRGGGWRKPRAAVRAFAIGGQRARPLAEPSAARAPEPRPVSSVRSCIGLPSGPGTGAAFSLCPAPPPREWLVGSQAGISPGPFTSHVNSVGGKKLGAEKGERLRASRIGRQASGRGFSKDSSPGIKPGTEIHLQMIRLERGAGSPWAALTGAPEPCGIWGDQEGETMRP